MIKTVYGLLSQLWTDLMDSPYGENEGENYGWSHAYGHSMLPCDGLHVVKINSTWMGRCDYLVLLWKESWLKLYSLRGYMIYFSSIRLSLGLYFQF
jgi:hypothetical protein